MQLESVRLEIPEDANLILGQSHFIKTVEDLYELIVGSGPHLRFGIAFSEASGPCLVRSDGNDESLELAAVRNVSAIASGHCFAVLLRGGFPIHILPRLHAVPEICNVFCATANPVEVIVVVTEQGRGILGVVDGFPPNGVEGEADKAVRRDFLRKIGYKR